MPDACVSAAATGLPSAKMPPALAAHLAALHVRAVGLQSVTRSLRLLIDVDMISSELLSGLLDVADREAVAVQRALDDATLQSLTD
ncbi:MAG: hypothetical protein CL868_13070 [Cytophagaceae bacterium]|nr:hypothetical protein [Cytophagaceae bacterium]|tara:strand:+ start:140 stop:397 length:258 start_codon:yes stop_codon:yes gene_type:complete